MALDAKLCLVSVPTADLNAAEQFYEELLGVEFAE